MKSPRKDRTAVRTETIAILVTPKDKQSIEQLAFETGISMSTLCRIALLQYLKEHGKEA